MEIQKIASPAGWIPCSLPKGIEEAKAAGKKLAGFTFDRAFSSRYGPRRNETMRIILEAIGQTAIPIEKDKALNQTYRTENCRG